MSAPDRAVIQVPKPLHAKLTEAKMQQEAQLGRQVSFGEIIEQWRMRALGLDMLAAQIRETQ